MADFFVVPPYGSTYYHFVVTPKNQFIFELLKLILVRMPRPPIHSDTDAWQSMKKPRLSLLPPKEE
jgi:hypothetical protein